MSLFQGKGEMKTYWLHGQLKLPQTSFPATPTLVEPPPNVDTLSSEILLDASETRSLYSPVTFEDVSRYSPIISPTNSSISDILPTMDSLKLQEPLVPPHIASHRKGNVSDVIYLGRRSSLMNNNKWAINCMISALSSREYR